MIRETNLAQNFAGADFVLSGEGQIAAQTVNGKVIACLAQLCQKFNVHFIVFAGSEKEEESIHELYASGVTAIIPTVRSITSLSEALEQAQENLSFALDSTLRMIHLLDK